MAEIELNVLIGQCLDRRIASIEALRNEVAAWQASRRSTQGKGQLAVHYRECSGEIFATISDITDVT